MSEIVTIGIRHHQTLESFIISLLADDVTYLLDTRHIRSLRNPLSPIFAANKKLEPALKKVGIEYSHDKSLGVPKSFRDKWIPDTKNPITQDEFTVLYSGLLDSRLVNLSNIKNDIDKHKKVALMCVCDLEDKPYLCHRKSLVALLGSPDAKDLIP